MNVRHGHARLNGTQLHWVTCGDGPLVVLLHGFPETWRSWRFQLDPLAEAGFRVLALDLRGYGESDLGGPYTLEQAADDVYAVMRAVGERRTHLVGHDWGGGVAWNFASRYREFCGRVGIINAPHPAPFQRALRSNPGQIRRSWYMFFFLLPRVAEWLACRNDFAFLRDFHRRADGAVWPADELNGCLEALARPGRLEAALQYYRTAVWAGLRSGAAFQHGQVEAPVKLWWGRADCWLDFETLVPGTAERFAPNLTVSLLDAHHYAHQERPVELNRELIEFLRGPAADVGGARRS